MPLISGSFKGQQGQQAMLMFAYVYVFTLMFTLMFTFHDPYELICANLHYTKSNKTYNSTTNSLD
jgi:cytochrome c oxidase assembly protein Cox11